MGEPNPKTPASTEADDATRIRGDVDLALEVQRLRRALDRPAVPPPPPSRELFSNYGDHVTDWRAGAPRWLLVILVGVLAAALLAIAIWYVSGLELQKARADDGLVRLNRTEDAVGTMKADVGAVKKEQARQAAVLQSIEWTIADLSVWQAERSGETTRAARLRKRFRKTMAGGGVDDDEPPTPRP